MKNKISFLAVLAFALNANCVLASECVGEDCELTPIEINETVETVDVLMPVKYEVEWIKPVSVISYEQSMCQHDYNCPFESAEECAIWYKKPLYKTNVAPRAPHINQDLLYDMIQVALANPTISGNDKTMSPLVQRYTMLMNASDACCTAGIVYKMRENGADDDDVYNFLKDDANNFAITKRCMVINDEDIASKYSYGVNGKMVADVRNACLCKNKQWFTSLLQPFNDMYESLPEFQSSPFYYTYKDGMNRELTVSINREVQTTLGLLSVCPK